MTSGESVPPCVEELRASALEVSIANKNGVSLDVLIEQALEWGADSILVDPLAFSRGASSRVISVGHTNVAGPFFAGCDGDSRLSRLVWRSFVLSSLTGTSL